MATRASTSRDLSAVKKLKGPMLHIPGYHARGREEGVLCAKIEFFWKDATDSWKTDVMAMRTGTSRDLSPAKKLKCQCFIIQATMRGRGEGRGQRYHNRARRGLQNIGKRSILKIQLQQTRRSLPKRARTVEETRCWPDRRPKLV